MMANPRQNGESGRSCDCAASRPRRRRRPRRAGRGARACRGRLARSVYEAGPAAGGRCRSYFDRELGCRIDNGNHLLLSGNRAAFAYLDAIGARRRARHAGRRRCSRSSTCAAARAGRCGRTPGGMPWWVCRRGRRVPGTRAARLSRAAARCAAPTADATVARSLRRGALYRPAARAARDRGAEHARRGRAAARLLGAVVRETLMRGGGACIPAFPRDGLSESLVDPALDLAARARRDDPAGRRIAGAAASPTAASPASARPMGRSRWPPATRWCSPCRRWVAADLLPGLTAARRVPGDPQRPFPRRCATAGRPASSV